MNVNYAYFHIVDMSIKYWWFLHKENKNQKNWPVKIYIFTSSAIYADIWLVKWNKKLELTSAIILSQTTMDSIVLMVQTSNTYEALVRLSFEHKVLLNSQLVLSSSGQHFVPKFRAQDTLIQFEFQTLVYRGFKFGGL